MADSIRDALTQAYAEKIVEPTDEANSAPAESSAPALDDASITSSDDSGTAEHKDPAPSVPGSDQTPEQGSPPDATPAPAAVSADPAPASWKAEEKAAWAALPPAAKAAIKRREADTLRALNTSSEARRGQESMTRALEPYQGFLQKHNVKDVMAEVVAPVLQIRSVLEADDPVAKATMLHNMITSFKVDVELLDKMLTDGPAQHGGRVPAPPAPRLDPRGIPEFEPLFAIADQLAAQTDAKLEGMIAEVSSLEHFEELREDIASVLKSYADRDMPITMQQAYDRALLLRPDLSPAPQGPAPVVTPSQAASILAKSRAAAVTVAGAPRSTPGKKPDTLRGSLEAAFDEVG